MFSFHSFYRYFSLALCFHDSEFHGCLLISVIFFPTSLCEIWLVSSRVTKPLGHYDARSCRMPSRMLLPLTYYFISQCVRDVNMHINWKRMFTPC